MSSLIQVKCATSFASISELMKSPAKRLSPVQLAAALVAAKSWSEDAAVDFRSTCLTLAC